MLQGLRQLLQLILINLAKRARGMLKEEEKNGTRYLFLVWMSIYVNWIVIDSLLIALSLSLSCSWSAVK